MHCILTHCIATTESSQSIVQVIAEHKAWVADKDLCGRIYLSTQGINAQYSGLAGHAEGYAKWLEQQELFKVRVPTQCLWSCMNAFLMLTV